MQGICKQAELHNKLTDAYKLLQILKWIHYQFIFCGGHTTYAITFTVRKIQISELFLGTHKYERMTVKLNSHYFNISKFSDNMCNSIVGSYI